MVYLSGDTVSASSKFKGSSVLEFGAGNSTMWWASTGAHVTALEGKACWRDHLAIRIPANVSLYAVSIESKERCLSSVSRLLDDIGEHYDVIVVDGLYREEMAMLAPHRLKETGVIVCDDSESYSLKELLKDSGLSRVDFYGQAPGVILPRCTSIWFPQHCPLMEADWPIERIYKS